MSNCDVFHLFHHLNECTFYNSKVLLQNHQSFFCFLLLYLGLLQSLLSLMEFLIQLFMNNNKTYIILFPFLLVGFKLKGINTMFNMLSFIQYYTLQTIQFQWELLNSFPIGSYSHPLPSWMMREQIPPIMFPGNPHVLKNTLFQLLHYTIQV
jgi:hypothetical protein